MKYSSSIRFSMLVSSVATQSRSRVSNIDISHWRSCPISSIIFRVKNTSLRFYTCIYFRWLLAFNSHHFPRRIILIVREISTLKRVHSISSFGPLFSSLMVRKRIVLFRFFKYAFILAASSFEFRGYNCDHWDHIASTWIKSEGS